jgi:microcystin-dependent protein
MSEPFVAEIRIFAGNFAPRGWAFCNGQLLPVSQNTALFSLIGTTYGGDGRTTTALPNLQGRAPMHPGRGPGLTARRLGEKEGVETVTLSEEQMPQHGHTAIVTEEDGRDNDPSNTSWVGAGDQMWGPAGNMNSMSDQTLSKTGGSQPHNNLQPFLTMSFIIALQGLYPSRS